MKKLLLCGILALAAGSMAFAQWPDGFSVSGELKTGVRMDFLGGAYSDKDWGGTNNPYFIEPGRDRSAFSIWNDDAGNRFQINWLFTQERYGFKASTRFNADRDNGGFVLPEAYGWFNFLNGMMKISGGKIDTGVWTAPAPDDRDMGKGLGVRLEVMPTTGLNFGVFISPAAELKDNKASSTLNDGVTSSFANTLASTNFGVKYESDMFIVAAGLDLQSQGQGRNTVDWDLGGRHGPVTSEYPSSNNEGKIVLGGGTVDQDKVAVSTYIGLQLNLVENLTLQVSGAFANLDKFDTWGWMHFSQKVAYNMSPLTIGLTMHQKLSGYKDTQDGGKNPDGDVKSAYLEFVPRADYSINDNLSAYFELPVKYWNEYFELGPKPGLTYKFGPGFELGCYYQFIINAHTDAVDNATAPIRNVVQLNFGWTF